MLAMPDTVAHPALSVPPSILAALQILPGDPIRWELRKGEAVLKATKFHRSVDDVAGMLAPHLQGKRIRWSAAQASAHEAWGATR